MALSAEAQARIDAMNDECEQRQIERGGTLYSIAGLSLEEITDLAAGCVPFTVIASCRMLLDDEDQIRRNAQRPVRKRKSA